MINPYRTDIPGVGPFYGRDEEISLLIDAVRNRRSAIAAIMGGRGMGKTTFALMLKKRLLEHEGLQDVYLIRRPEAKPENFLAQLGTCLKFEINENLPTDSLIEAVDATESKRVVFIIDEVEALINREEGRSLLSNIRIAYEELGGRLAVFILGGSSLRDLLSSDTSPFLRTAQWVPLRGLSCENVARLIREPCDIRVSDDIVEMLWEHTGGHPYLIQSIMEKAINLDDPIFHRLPEIIDSAILGTFDRNIFPIWWDNLQDRGQDVYRRLLSQSTPLDRKNWVRVLGPEPGPWLEILETTGIARINDGAVLPRGMFFREWMAHNHPRKLSNSVVLDVYLDKLLKGEPFHLFEQKIVDSMSRWTADVVEFPLLALKSGKTSGNNRILPEQNFQLQILIALRQQGLLIEPEPLSSDRGRTDLKIRWPDDPDRRACTEVKIWGRNDYLDVIDQLLGYAIPSDEFGCVVMIDRQARPLALEYKEKILDAAPMCEIVSMREGKGSSTGPAFVTRHKRTSAGRLRIYHFLLQLPSGT
jgi:hypothetical protein